MIPAVENDVKILVFHVWLKNDNISDIIKNVVKLWSFF